jgi:hypothetical protein
MIPRILSEKLRHFATKYPIVTVTGPRQSGKTTLIRSCFPDYEYVSFEDPDILLMAKDDPRLFLKRYRDKTIFDEAQRFPELFSYLQSAVDLEGKTGMYILSGSQNFQLMEKISQSLAGRTAIMKLMPLSFPEIKNSGHKPHSIDNVMFQGCYPRIFDKQLLPKEFYPFYIQTYIERDVRQIQNILNLNLFIRFVKLCAGRIGQLLNISSLATECGITQPTAKAWLSVLEASYIVYLLKPYYKNQNKRLVKTPKLYFLDTGLACSLLGIQENTQMFAHYLRGELFENWIISEKLKAKFNAVEDPNFYFWRDNVGNEIDLIIENAETLQIFEIKSGSTYRPEFFKAQNYIKGISGLHFQPLTVVYGGDNTLETKQGMLVSWKDWVG